MEEIMAKRLVVFNHKGGVSKTTSAYNIGWKLSERMRILLVDADPQCNLSGLILQDGFEQYYFDEATRLNNIKDGVAPAFGGKPVPIQAVDCPSLVRAPNLFLLPGHANLSEYDAALTFAQTSNNAIATLQNLPGAFAELLRLTEERYNIDLTIIDLNPGLSAINQNFFLISDAFIVPTNPDPFSLMALDTLQAILPRWVSWKETSLHLFEDSAYPLPVGTPKFVGTLIQRFNIRNGRAAKPYRDNIGEINSKVKDGFFPALKKVGMVLPSAVYNTIDNYCLAEVPDFQGLLPKSQAVGVPVFAVRDEEINETGPVLENFKTKRDAFNSQYDAICVKIAESIRHA